MSANVDEGARRLGENLLAEVEADDLSSVCGLVNRPQPQPDCLFDASRHKSTHRCVHSIILDDADAFIWSIRNVASSASTPNHSLTTASSQLTSLLHRLTTQLSCSAILSSHSISPTSFRPALPSSWPQNMDITRLAIRRVEVLKFAPAISVEEADGEGARRWDVVKRGRSECWKVGMGIKGGEGFVFRVGEMGVEVERAEEK